MRSSISRSLRRIARAPAITGTAPGPRPPAGRPSARAHVGLGQRSLHVVAHEHAGAARGACRSAARAARRRRGRDWRAARRAAGARDRGAPRVAAASRWTRPLDRSRTGSSALFAMPTSASTSSTRWSPDPVEPCVVAQVLAAAQLAVEERLVAHVAHLRRELPALAGQLGAEHACRAAVRAQQPGEHAQQGRLPGSVAAEHRERLPLVDAHADVGERDPLAVPPLEAFELDRSHARKPMLRMWHGWSASTTWRSSRRRGRGGRLLRKGLRPASCAGGVPGMAFLDMGDQFLALAQATTGHARRRSPLRPRRRRRRRRADRPARRRASRWSPAAASTSATRGATGRGGPVLGDPVHEGTLGAGRDGPRELGKSESAQQELRDKGLGP